MTNNKNNTTLSESEKHQHHVEGGYKATLTNPKASEEAKKHAQEMLDKLSKGEKISDEDRTKSNNYAAQYSEEEKHQHHIEGGYKATLTNPKASEEAKKHAQEMLDKLAKGEELSAEDKQNSSNYAAEFTEEEKHNHHVAGGYKATLSNPNSSEEAKKHAKEQLEKLGEEYSKDDKSESHGHKRSADESGETDSKEGHKGKQGFASMSKEKVQEIASKGGRTVNAGEEPLPKKGKSDEFESKKTDSPKKSSKDTSDLTEEQKHNHHVAGGYKATLSNPNSSEEAKKHAQEMLDSMDVEYSKDDKETKSSDKDNKKSDKEEGHKGKQGFASMPKEKVQEIASKGGRTKHAGEEPTSVKQQ